MKVREKSVYLSDKNGVFSNIGNRVIAGAAGGRPHIVQYYVHFPFSILNFSFQTAYDHCKFHQNVVLLMYHRTGEIP